MANGKNDDWLKLPTIGIIAFVAAIAGHIWKSPVPYADEHPGSGAAISQEQPAAQDVEARLWQDPFSLKPETQVSDQASFAVNVHADANKLALQVNRAPSRGAGHGINRIYFSKTLPSGRLTIIAALLPGGKYSENVETRLRYRYALLSALTVRGFAPEDAEYLGFVDVSPSGSKDSSDRQRMWFEWFSARDNANQHTVDKVLVLWIDWTALNRKAPLADILYILQQATPQQPHVQPAINYAVIGPNDSGQLAALVEEVFTSSPKMKPHDGVAANQVTFFPAIATAPDDVLLKDATRHCFSSSLSECLLTKGIRLSRSTSDDASLARALVVELKLRGVKPQEDHIVLLSERDSLYGREFPETFKKAYQDDAPSSLDHVYQVSYVRGIDGKLPGMQDKTEAPAVDNKKGSEAAKPQHAAIERPEGQSQKDYLRRLVERVFEEERQIRSDGCPVTKRCGIAAIGVLGYDVYDKLVILQALRDRFPGKIFFTTGLDALYLHPDELPHTHNLIVASAFDLRLRDELQLGIPPFRDSDQTAVFLSILLAMQNTASADPPPRYHLNPLVFEIGRHQHVPLNVSSLPFGGKADGCKPAALSQCGNFQPLPPQRWPQAQFVLLALALMAGAVLAARMSWTVREWLLHNLRPRVSGLVVVGIAILIALVPACPYFPGPDGEPFYWANGVSVWPSEILRVLALVISVALISKARNVIKTDKSGNGGYLARFLLPETTIAGWKPPSTVNRWNGPKVYCEINVAQLLSQYHVMGKGKRRRYRAMVNFAWFAVFAVLIILLWGMPRAPTRGALAQWIDFFVMLTAASAVTYLTVWIVDAARLCERMIHHLAQASSRWPDSTRAHFASTLNMREDDGVADWIDMKFVARHTTTVQKLIWYPVVPVLLLVAARNNIFDDWDFPLSMIITLGLTLGYAFSCLFLMQFSAKQARNKAVLHLTELLDRLSGDMPRDEQRIAQVEELRTRVASMKDGAFQPLTEQPMFKALLMLLGGGGLAGTNLQGLFS